MGDLIQDLRYALRMLLKNPAFTAAGVLTLALGIAANIGTFSLVNAFVNLPQRFADPETLVFLELTDERNRSESIRPADYLAWREGATSFTEIALFERRRITATGHGEPERLRTVRATASLLPMLGLEPQLGRLHTAAEDSPGAERVVLLTDGFWKRRFDSRPDVLGESLNLNGEAHTVIGVLPPEFYTEQLWFETALLTPLRIDLSAPQQATGRTTVLARLRPGIGVEQAGAEMDVIAAGLAAANPEGGLERRVTPRPFTEAFVSDGDLLAFYSMLGAVGLVLVIACANLANLQLARSTARGREFAVRTALGADRGRILRQLLTESLLLAALGGGLGLLLGTWAADLAVVGLEEQMAPAYMPIERHEVGAGWPAVAYTIGLSLIAALVSGLAPALTASRAPVETSLKEGQSWSSAGPSRNRLRNALVVGQLAVALPLLICSVLTFRHVQGIKRVDYGFTTERLLTMRVDLPEHRYATEAEWARFYRDAVETLGALPGVERVGAAATVPVIFFNALAAPVTIEGREAPDPARPDRVAYEPMTPGFFQTLEVPLLRGRYLSDADRAGGLPVGIINSQMARRYWPDEDPIGRRVALTLDPTADDWITIVGEVGDAGRSFWGDPPSPTLFVPLEQRPHPAMIIAARTSGDPMQAMPAVRGAIHAMDEEIPVHHFRTVQGLIHEVCRDDRLTVGFLAGLAVLSLILASIGLYGVMSFLVEQRTQEIGVRVALGASYLSIMRLILRRCLRLAAIGIVVGVVLAVPVGLGIASELWDVSGIDPLSYAVVSVVLLLVGLLAGYVPARRAARVDPIVALRYE